MNKKFPFRLSFILRVIVSDGSGALDVINCVSCDVYVWSFAVPCAKIVGIVFTWIPAEVPAGQSCKLLIS